MARTPTPKDTPMDTQDIRPTENKSIDGPTPPRTVSKTPHPNPDGLTPIRFAHHHRVNADAYRPGQETVLHIDQATDLVAAGYAVYLTP